MSLKKKILIAAGAIIASVFALLVALILLLDVVVENSIETIAPKILGVPVEIGSIKISPFFGRVAIDDFVIGNPEGYHTDSALSVRNLVFHVDPFSVLSDKIRIRELTIHGVRINFETNLASSNLTGIYRNVNQFSSKEKDPKTSKPEPQPDSQPDSTEQVESGSSKKFQIDRIDLNDIVVIVAIKGVKNSDIVPIPIPPYYLENLGTGPEGASAAEITVAVLKGLLDGISKSVAGTAISDSVKSSLSSALDGIQSGTSGLKEATHDALKKAGDALKSLF